jgi:molybdate transport system substrate-binding protein
VPGRLPAALALPALALALAACAGGDDDRPTAYAASSLKEALPAALGDDVVYAFAGSDDLALQIREGAPADLFAAASPRHPDELAGEGLCEAPVPFASNTLVVLVPAGDPAGVGGVEGLAGPEPLRLAIGQAGVPIGDYAREALDALGLSDALASNTVSDEPDAASIVAKVASGSADAGIAYATDAAAAGGGVEAYPLPEAADPTVVYTACAVVREGGDPAVGRELLDRLIGPEAQAALADAGFGRAP